MDIQAAVSQPVALKPGAIVLIPTGFAMALPKGYEAQIRPRSGLAVKHGIGLINAPGTIDADYRGEVMVALVNLGSSTFTVKRCDRIAQMVIQKVYRLEVALAEHLDQTDREDGGFGHTGMR
jgi:dUTP pyrophosphatase